VNRESIANFPGGKWVFQNLNSVLSSGVSRNSSHACDGLTCVYTCIDDGLGSECWPKREYKFPFFLAEGLKVKFLCIFKLVGSFGETYMSIADSEIHYPGLSYLNHSHESKSKNLATSALILLR